MRSGLIGHDAQSDRHGVIGVEGLGVDPAQDIIREAKFLALDAAGVFTNLLDGEVVVSELGAVGISGGDRRADVQIERGDEGGSSAIATAV